MQNNKIIIHELLLSHKAKANKFPRHRFMWLPGIIRSSESNATFPRRRLQSTESWPGTPFGRSRLAGHPLHAGWTRIYDEVLMTMRQQSGRGCCRRRREERQIRGNGNVSAMFPQKRINQPLFSPVSIRLITKEWYLQKKNPYKNDLLGPKLGTRTQNSRSRQLEMKLQD